ncbi:MAG TPA: hypothetical protein VKB09_10785 [Thermomicrobiales bacterium]|nr:hypothetical protein [Thermomicrobiales bacterium]
MAKATTIMSRQAEIEEVMRTTNLLYPEAAAAVARRYGEDVSDIVGPDGRPLSPEQKRRLGLGRSIVEFMQPDTEASNDAGTDRAHS